ncbi:MAG: Sec-independent protein translocase protein TatB [Sulfurimonadaceae bacterium]|nr:Sec-independent protein translocase protein TatB [Arcobacteraceae bacterium]
MFGMGFFEILLVAVIAIIALGPEKLPTAMVEVARFFKKFKSGIDEAKSTLDNELQLSDMKEEASKFKAQIDNVKSSVKLENLDLGVNDILNEEPKPAPTKKEEPQGEKVSFKKKESSSSSDKFKVNKKDKENEGADA